MNTKFLNIVICPNCNGAGRFELYKHIADGVCFRCNGDCVVEEWGREELPPISKHEARKKYFDSLKGQSELEEELNILEELIKPLEKEYNKNVSAINTLENSKQQYKNLPNATELAGIFDQNIEKAKVEADKITNKLIPLKEEYRDKLNQLVEQRNATRK